MRFVIGFIKIVNDSPAPYALEREADLKPKSLDHEAELLRAQGGCSVLKPRRSGFMSLKKLRMKLHSQTTFDRISVVS